MTKPATAVVDAIYDEVSTVDKPANQYGHIVIAKRADQEDAVPDDDYEDEVAIFDEDGIAVDPDELAIGDVVYAEDGSAFEVTEDDGDGDYYDGEDEDFGKSVTPSTAREAAAVFNGNKAGRARQAVSRASDKAWGNGTQARNRKRVAASHGRLAAGVAGGTAVGGVGGYQLNKSALAEIQDELSKAVTEADTMAVLSKAFGEVEARAEEAEARIELSEQVAKSERDLRLSREYIAKASEYNVGVPADRLGPVLMRMAETMDYADCAVVHKSLLSAGALREIGKSGGAANGDPFGVIDELMDGQITKSADRRISKEAQVTDFFDSNPEAYDEYRRARAGR